MYQEFRTHDHYQLVWNQIPNSFADPDAVTYIRLGGQNKSFSAAEILAGFKFAAEGDTPYNALSFEPVWTPSAVTTLSIIVLAMTRNGAFKQIAVGEATAASGLRPQYGLQFDLTSAIITEFAKCMENMIKVQVKGNVAGDSLTLYPTFGSV